MTLEEWTETIKESVDRFVEQLDPKDDVIPLLHVSTAGKEIVIGLDLADKDEQVDVIRQSIKQSRASRAAFIVAAWARIASEEAPFSDREKAAMESGEYAASVSPDRIEVIAVTVGEGTRFGPRLGSMMARVERSDGPPKLHWDDDVVLFESTDSKARIEGRFPDAIRKGLS